MNKLTKTTLYIALLVTTLSATAQTDTISTQRTVQADTAQKTAVNS